MIKLFIIFLLSFTSINVHAEECAPGFVPNPVSSLSSNIADVAEKSSCTKKTDEDSVLDYAIGCLGGGGKAVGGMIKGFAQLVKLLVWDAPAYLFKESKEKITKLLQGDLDPIDMVSAIASINMSSQESLWDKAQEYWESFKKFAGDLKNQLMTEMKNFPCLPGYKQSEIICHGVTDVFLVVFGPQKFLAGAKWAINSGKALKNFVVQTKAARGMENMSVAERLNLAAKTLEEGASKGTELLKLRNSSLTETVLPNGEKILHYEQKIKGADGKIHVVKREVPLDAKTGAIDSNSAIGKEILGEAVQSKAGSGSLIFVDVNHLGKVNYFQKGTQGGDEYLANVADALRKSLRPGDMVFKNGGDELVVVLANNNPKMVQQISQRMINEVDNNPQIRSLFRQEVSSLAQTYKEVNRAKKVAELPAEMRRNMSAAEVMLANKDFAKFANSKKDEIMKAMQDQATYRGSISVGSTVVKHDEKVADVLSRAEQQAARVKAEYKARYGHDVSKYKIDVTENIGPRHGPPVAMEPL